MSKRVKVSFEVEVPDVVHTDEELEDWLRWEFGDNGRISCNNPFEVSGMSAEPVFGTFVIESH